MVTGAASGLGRALALALVDIDAAGGEAWGSADLGTIHSTSGEPKFTKSSKQASGH
jgi:NADP-dependent 3-hydroxy acid dehydrogenase YdfG